MKNLEILMQALNKANQSGAFTLNEAAIISNSLNSLQAYVETLENEVSSYEDSKKGVVPTPKVLGMGGRELHGDVDARD